MSLISLVATMLIVGAEPIETPQSTEELTLAELIARWNSECNAGGGGTECSALAAHVELGLYDIVRKLALNRLPIEREVVRAAADSDLPALAKFGVGMLGEPKSPEEVRTLLRALDHPVFAVRQIAARNLGNANAPEWKAIEHRWSASSLGFSAREPAESLIPDLRPQPEQFGVASFKGLTFHYYGSDSDRAMFTASESVDAFIKREGVKRRVMTSLDAAMMQIDALQPELEAVQAEMAAALERQDMAALDAANKKMEVISQKMSGAQGSFYDPSVDSRTIILEEDKATKRVIRKVTVERDNKMNATVVIFWREGGWR